MCVCARACPLARVRHRRQTKPDLRRTHRWPGATIAVFPSPSSAEHRPRHRASTRSKAVGRIVEPRRAARVDPSRSRSPSIVLSASLPASASVNSGSAARASSTVAPAWGLRQQADDKRRAPPFSPWVSADQWQAARPARSPFASNVVHVPGNRAVVSPLQLLNRAGVRSPRRATTDAPLRLIGPVAAQSTPPSRVRQDRPALRAVHHLPRLAVDSLNFGRYGCTCRHKHKNR
ncbi:Uncharacterized protein M6B38_217265 [Iris pallida]|uniref:Uncharacterized protein n=1 Tax=Iris pallida TaxID=29817 RepID=A0AAX6E0J7_IRIPA|nr:Uncharacterized protein M6B38_217265 [Iris pallida]